MSNTENRDSPLVPGSDGSRRFFLPETGSPSLDPLVHVPLFKDTAAGVREKHTGRDHGQGCFAGTGFSYEAENLTGPKRKIRRAEGFDLIVCLADLLQLKLGGNASPEATNPVASNFQQGNGLFGAIRDAWVQRG
jgi:hypothetical protein